MANPRLASELECRVLRWSPYLSINEKQNDRIDELCVAKSREHEHATHRACETFDPQYAVILNLFHQVFQTRNKHEIMGLMKPTNNNHDRTMCRSGNQFVVIHTTIWQNHMTRTTLLYYRVVPHDQVASDRHTRPCREGSTLATVAVKQGKK